MTKQTLIVNQVLLLKKNIYKVIIPNKNIEGCVDRISPPRNGDVGFLL